jgi:hypothetical protein
MILTINADQYHLAGHVHLHHTGDERHSTAFRLEKAKYGCNCIN